jgi:hypothetical protein
MTIFLNGGVGKSIAFTAILPDVSKKYGELFMVSPWPDVFEGQPGVKRSLDHGAAYGYEDYVKGRDIMWPEPYQTVGYFSRKRNLIAAFADACGVEYRADMRPLTPPKIAKAPATAPQLGRYVLVQFQGGANQWTQGPKQPGGQVRDYPNGQAVVDAIKKGRPDVKVINFALQTEPHFNGEEKVEGHMHYMVAWTLLRDAAAWVGIDSSMHHMAAACGKKGVVLWEGTDPDLLGYPDQVNLRGDCPLGDAQCMRPWTMPVLDNLAQGRPWECPSRGCQDIKPERVYAELEKLLGAKP